MSSSSSSSSSSSTPIPNLKATDDKFTGTEYQHDFGSKCGIIRRKIENSDSIPYKNNIKELLWASNNFTTFTDEGIVKEIFGVEKSKIYNPNNIDLPEGYNNYPPSDTTVQPQIIWEYSRTRIYASGERKRNFRYEIRSIPIDRLVYGESLANWLGIPNKSICIVDVDKGILKKRLKKGTASPEFILYSYMNSITISDPGPFHGTRSASAGNIFNNRTGIFVQALVNRDAHTLRGDNSDLNMNYKIQNIPILDSMNNLSKSNQNWKYPANETEGTSNEITNAHKENTVDSICNSIKKRRSDGLTFVNRDYIGLGDEEEDKKYALMLMRKRSGDLFQGWMTKHLKNHGGNVVKYYCSPSEKQPKEQGGSISISTIAGEGGDIFTLTHDYPYLCWCIDNGVNVLFRQNNKIIYFRRTT